MTKLYGKNLIAAMLAAIALQCGPNDVVNTLGRDQNTLSTKAKRLQKNVKLSQNMRVEKRRVNTTGDEASYFNQKIPEQVHQIWFGDAGSMPMEKVLRWQAYCEAHSIPYRLWTDEDVQEIFTILPQINHKLFNHLFFGRHLHAASDVFRIALLRHFGGIYVDVDIGPPIVDGVIRSMETFFPFTGFVAMGEHHARDIGAGSIFLANGFLMAAKEHPLLLHLEDSLVAHIEALHGGPLEPKCASYATPQLSTGPFYLSRNIYGPITTTPISYLIELGMVD